MEPARLLVGVILLPLLGDDVLLELLVGVVGVPAEGSALFQELKNVDHPN